MISTSDTIAAIATPPGMGAIAVLRISGSNAFSLLKQIFRTQKNAHVDIDNLQSHTMRFGTIVHNEAIIDEVLISIFKNPHSYTGEDTVEISCHGAVYIQQKLLQIIISNGARMAAPGEFTMRAFMNKKLELSQAEAVGELIASDSAARHRTALNQLRGGIKNEIQELRKELIHAASLLELELDFSEEDVEFVSRADLKKLIQRIEAKIVSLLHSFETGNALRNGIPVVIAGSPNVGKSTLLNALIKEDRAIVSEIAGTTRDTIEETFFVEGIKFRFIDTAGIRHTTDTIEKIGIARTFEKIQQSAIVICLIDAAATNTELAKQFLSDIKTKTAESKIATLCVINKIDIANEENLNQLHQIENAIFISAKQNLNIEQLTQAMLNNDVINNLNLNNELVINLRHKEALQNTMNALESAGIGLHTNVTTDWIAQDIRMALYHLGTVSGEISTDDLLENIFSKFCIGK
jgi:tRNA modification GTPase